WLVRSPSLELLRFQRQPHRPTTVAQPITPATSDLSLSNPTSNPSTTAISCSPFLDAVQPSSIQPLALIRKRPRPPSSDEIQNLFFRPSISIFWPLIGSRVPEFLAYHRICLFVGSSSWRVYRICLCSSDLCDLET
ncbi:hypothetical protein L2E82_38012, partial [Cichorium intybus]